jgi:ADP-ribose pyrophosphatase YjhB (NUDIX family)
MAKQILKASVHAFILDGNNILLLKRANTGYCDGMYSLPAGHIDDNEPASHAMLRELQEEVNITTTADKLTVVLSSHRTTDEHPYFNLYYSISDFNKNLIINNEPEKCDELKWFDLDELPENIVPYIKKAINAYLDGEIYLED